MRVGKKEGLSDKQKVIVRTTKKEQRGVQHVSKINGRDGACDPYKKGGGRRFKKGGTTNYLAHVRVNPGDVHKARRWQSSECH